MKKVLLTGTISVGKTTLFDAIDKSDDIVKIPEAARRILQDVPNLRLTPYFQRALLLEQYFLENEAKKANNALTVCDRGYIDVEAYSRFLGHPIDSNLISSFEPYDLIFYCHPEGTPPLLTEIPNEKELVDESLRNLLSELSTPVVTLKGQTSERLQQFYAGIEKLNLKKEK